MMTAVQHLAQLAIGRFRRGTDDPRMAGFMNNPNGSSISRRMIA
jgi:hypothetical protein